jgi:hypothetical protein
MKRTIHRGMILLSYSCFATTNTKKKPPTGGAGVSVRVNPVVFARCVRVGHMTVLRRVARAVSDRSVLPEVLVFVDSTLSASAPGDFRPVFLEFQSR